MTCRVLSSFLFLIIISMAISESDAGEKSIYNFSWLDKDKEVYVLQNRKFRKAGKFHLNLGTGITTSGAFVDSKSHQARAGFFLMEDWGVEGIYVVNDGEENDTAASVRNEGAAGSIPFRRIINNYKGVLLLWSPFYGKINTFNMVVYLDWMIGVGYAKINETNNRQSVLIGVNRDDTTEDHTALIWETALKFYLNEYFSVRLDLTVLHYEAMKAKTTGEKAYYSNYDATLSLGFNF